MSWKRRHILIYMYCKRSWGVLSRLTILAEWPSHFSVLAVGETAAPARFSRENAEGAGMPPSRQGRINEMTRHVDTGVKGGGTPREHVHQKIRRI
jgi:hypothetical protein